MSVFEFYGTSLDRRTGIVYDRRRKLTMNETSIAFDEQAVTVLSLPRRSRGARQRAAGLSTSVFAVIHAHTRPVYL
jgi:hypothetical protein